MSDLVGNPEDWFSTMVANAILPVRACLHCFNSLMGFSPLYMFCFLGCFQYTLRPFIFVFSSPALATFETSQVLLAGGPGGFFTEFSRFSPTY